MKIIIETKQGTPMKAYEIGPQHAPPKVISIGMWAFMHVKTEKRGPAQDEYAIYTEAVTLRLVGGENAAPITGDEFEDLILEASRHTTEDDDQTRDNERVMASEAQAASAAYPPIDSYWRAEDGEAVDGWHVTRVDEPLKTIHFDSIKAGACSIELGDWESHVREGRLTKVEEDVPCAECGESDGFHKPGCARTEVINPSDIIDRQPVCQSCGGTRKATNSEGQASATLPCPVCAADDYIISKSGVKVSSPPKPLPPIVDRTAEDEAILAKLKGEA